MNSKEILTPSETWSNFWAWIKLQPEWESIGRSRKQYLYKTDREMKQGTVKVKRLQRILETHAAGRYEYADGFVIRENRP